MKIIKKIREAIPLYGTVTVLILGWWLLAFSSPSSNPKTPLTEEPTSKKNNPLLSSLSPLKREVIHTALTGNIELMAHLIAEWDFDAQILENAGIDKIKRLPSSIFIRSQVLKRQLTNSSPNELSEFQNYYREKHVTDDLGMVINLVTPLKYFLPQTYVSASFLLALLPPEQIIAIPHDLRDQTELYPIELTKKIPLDINRFNSETLFHAQPQIAFVAHYSSPATIEALHEQGIPLFTITKIDTLSEIMHALNRIGHVVNRPMEAELLNIFIEAAMISIDNRLASLKVNVKNGRRPRILFLNYVSQYSIPANKTLSGQLLQRAEIQNMEYSKESDDRWTIPLEQEEIVNFQPDYLIISTSSNPSLHKQIELNPAFAGIINKNPKRIAFVDANIQSSPSQYIVLAYFDIYKALSGAYLND